MVGRDCAALDHITHTMNRDEHAGTVCVVIQFPSKKTDVHIDRSSVGTTRIKSPDLQKYFIS
jgi:hypothetical protein